MGIDPNTIFFAGFAIGFLVVAISSFWVYSDAEENKISVDGKPYETNNGAVAWLLSCLLLWIVFFPYYLYKKNQALSPAVGAGNAQSVEDQLKKYKKMVEDELITIEDYEKKKKQLLGL